MFVLMAITTDERHFKLDKESEFNSNILAQVDYKTTWKKTE